MRKTSLVKAKKWWIHDFKSYRMLVFFHISNNMIDQGAYLCHTSTGDRGDDYMILIY